MGRLKRVKNPGEKLWHTTGVKFWSESEVPGWHSAIKVQGGHSALCRVPPQHIAPDGSKLKILTRREYFASYLYANGLPPGFFTHFGRPTLEKYESFSPGFFTPFWRAMAGNYESVFLTIMRPNGTFNRRATKIYVWSFWPLCDQERHQKSAINGGLIMVADGGTGTRLLKCWKAKWQSSGLPKNLVWYHWRWFCLLPLMIALQTAMHPTSFLR